MNNFLLGMAGGIVPAGLMLIVYFMSFSGRIARIETDISWLKREYTKCRPPSKIPLA